MTGRISDGQGVRDNLQVIQSPGLSLVFSADEVECARSERRLLSLDIELTRRCNLHCVYCYAACPERQKGELTLKEITHIINLVHIRLVILSTIGHLN